MGNAGSGYGIRRIVTLVAVVLCIISAAVVGSLVVLTTTLHDASALLRDTVSEVRLARQVEIDLLLREHSEDPVERERLEQRLHGSLREADERIMSSTTTQLLREDAKVAVDRYLAARDSTVGTAPTSEPQLQSALSSIDALVRSHVDDANRAKAGAAQLDELGDVMGAVAAVLMIAVPALLVWWIGVAVVRPILCLSNAMDRFGKGDLTVRAPALGAAELRRMTGQFNAMGEALMRQHEARLAHLAGVAHDLRNPLAALQMSAALVDTAGAPVDQGVLRAFAVVRRQVGRLTRMVDDLLDATRIEAGQLSLVLRESDLRAAVRTTVELFQNTSSIHSLQVELPTEPLCVYCDSLRIEQTLNNLLSNAIKYSPRGGSVRISAYRDDGVACVSVSDQGTGIAEADVDQIWEPFTRKGVSAEAAPGVGLGLWTSKKIVDAHRGTLVVTSEIGKGSTFTLRLPLTSEGSAAALGGDTRYPVLSHG